jgi:phospholipid/cholesterol/gamma-HCH transport system substrate-binding protein
VQPEEDERRGGAIARIAGVTAVIGAVLLVAALLFVDAGGGYTVKARFTNGGQLVKGNLVEVGGVRAGTVTGYRITPDGIAEVDLRIDEEFAPLRVGTTATIRQNSQSSTVGRYVELFLPGEDQAGGNIGDGDVISVDRTTSTVELDQLFNTLDRGTRKNLRDLYAGLNRAYTGRGEQGNAGLRYLSPQLATTTRVFEELRHDPAVLERFLVDSSRLVTTLASRRDDLSALIGNLNLTTRALGSDREALAQVLERFPDFMRQANTTYVDLRGTLDELEPFVDASKPVAKRLQPYLRELRPFARDARPTVRDLSRMVRESGPDNDLLDLQRTYPPLADIALVEKNRSIDFGTGPVQLGQTEGAFPELARSLAGSTPIIAHGRPYAPDFVGWMDDFSHTGGFDANGSFSRTQTLLNAFSPSDGSGVVGLLPLSGRADVLRRFTRTQQVKRCPGASEAPAPDGSNVWSEEERRELDCLEEHRATGDYTPNR